MTDALSANHIAGQEGGFEPQRQSNWQLEIALAMTTDVDIVKLSMSAAPLPNESSEEISIPWGNETRFAAGKTVFDEIALSIRDYVDQETRAAILRWRRAVYDPLTGAVGYAKDYKKDATITLLGPDGGMERQCKLEGCWPKAVNPGSLDHSSSEQVMIEVTLRYDKAVWIL